MKSAIDQIVENADRYPEFRYYIPIIRKAEKNRANQPDICIEICKSLFEGISKSIIERINPETTRKELDDMETGPLVKRAARALRSFDNIIEDDFVNRCTSLAYAFAQLRNSRGDISHGRAAPKKEVSTERLAFLSLQMTEGVISYMLDSFYSLDIDRSKEQELPPGRGEAEPIKYDHNSDFNDFLDDIYPLDGKLIYSSALYQLYYEDYVIQLSAFHDDQEMVEE